MNGYFPIVAISIAILVILFVRAILIMRAESGKTERGSEPGVGDHIIDSSYFSGGGGGGSQSTFRVPKDPQEYAKGFVPRQKEDDT